MRTAVTCSLHKTNIWKKKICTGFHIVDQSQVLLLQRQNGQSCVTYSDVESSALLWPHNWLPFWLKKVPMKEVCSLKKEKKTSDSTGNKEEIKKTTSLLWLLSVGRRWPLKTGSTVEKKWNWVSPIIFCSACRSWLNKSGGGCPYMKLNNIPVSFLLCSPFFRSYASCYKLQRSSFLSIDIPWTRGILTLNFPEAPVGNLRVKKTLLHWQVLKAFFCLHASGRILQILLKSFIGSPCEKKSLTNTDGSILQTSRMIVTGSILQTSRTSITDSISKNITDMHYQYITKTV